MQNALGADIIMAFDECPAADAPREYHVTAVERTIRWARAMYRSITRGRTINRCLASYKEEPICNCASGVPPS